MPEKPQIELADIQEPSENKSDGLEITRTPELENVVDKANELAEAIQQDRKITGEQVLDLDKDLGELKFDVAGELMTFDEISEIPDANHNISIWKEIARDDGSRHEELTYVDRYISHILSESDYSHSNNPKFLDLRSIKHLSEDAAEELSSFTGTLILKGMEHMPEEILEIISRSRASILILGLTSINSEEAKVLANFQGNKLSFEYLDSIADEASRALSQINGFLEFDKLRNISDAGMTFFAKKQNVYFHNQGLQKRFEKLSPERLKE